MRLYLFARVLRDITVTAGTFAAAVCAGVPANASMLWDWSYSGSGITAGGTLITGDSPNAAGGYLITGITGSRNGVEITGLQATGTAIPGNEPFGVDNLVFRGPGPQLTGDGFGYATADGNFANPFYADFLPTPGYLEFFSAPPFTPGVPGPEDSEDTVGFSAGLVATPEPGTGILVFGVLGLAVLRVRVKARC